jgi:hypothetical protein
MYPSVHAAGKIAIVHILRGILILPRYRWGKLAVSIKAYFLKPDKNIAGNAICPSIP